MRLNNPNLLQLTKFALTLRVEARDGQRKPFRDCRQFTGAGTDVGHWCSPYLRRPGRHQTIAFLAISCDTCEVCTTCVFVSVTPEEAAVILSAISLVAADCCSIAAAIEPTMSDTSRG